MDRMEQLAALRARANANARAEKAEVEVERLWVLLAEARGRLVDWADGGFVDFSDPTQAEQAHADLICRVDAALSGKEDADLDDVVADHPIAMAELAALRAEVDHRKRLQPVYEGSPVTQAALNALIDQRDTLRAEVERLRRLLRELRTQYPSAYGHDAAHPRVVDLCDRVDTALRGDGE